MLRISRRDLIIAAPLAAVVFGLDKRLTIFGASPAAAAAATEAGFYKFKVGDIEMTALYDGIWEKDHDPGFIKNVSVDDTKAALIAGGLKADFVPITFSVMVAKIGGKLVMFDSGTGGQVSPKAGLMMSKGMAAAGIDPGKIETILVTHLHPDHIFGLMAKDTNAQVFPNAEIVIAAKEYGFWMDPALIGKLPDGYKPVVQRLQSVFPGWKNVRQIEADKEVIPGVHSVATYGHTPGHTSYMLGSGKSVLHVLGDVSNIPALFLKHPNWQAVFDSDGDMAAATRHAVMDRVVAEGSMVAGYHYPFPAAGSIAKDGDGYAFTPAA